MMRDISSEFGPVTYMLTKSRYATKCVKKTVKHISVLIFENCNIFKGILSNGFSL